MKRLVNWTVVALICLVIYLIGEGVLAIKQWERPHRSLTYQAVQKIDGTVERAELRFFRPVLTDPKEMEVLLGDMRAAGIGLGNSPYEQLRTEMASTIRTVDGCPQNRPNMNKTMTYLRTPLFEMFNPVVMFYDSDRELSNRLQRFVKQYAVRLTTFTTDEFGQRNTVPAVDRQEIVFIAGDSVAAGAMINDDETLASVLQRRDPYRRYINLGTGGAEAAEIRCNVELAAARYSNRVQELIYVYCENDFDQEESMGTPEAVINLAPAVRARPSDQPDQHRLRPLHLQRCPGTDACAGRTWRTLQGSRRREGEIDGSGAGCRLRLDGFRRTRFGGS